MQQRAAPFIVTVLGILLLACQLPLAWAPCGFYTAPLSLLQYSPALANSSLYSALVSCPKLRFAVPGASTDGISDPLAALSALPSHLAHSVLYRQPAGCETPWQENGYVVKHQAPSMLLRGPVI